MSIALAIVVEEDGRTTEVSNIEGEPLETARSIVKRVDNREEGKKSFEDKGYIFNVLIAGAVVYLCAGKAGDLKGRIAFDFLTCVKTEYQAGGYEDNNISNYARFVRNEMERYADPSQVDKISKIQNKIEDVKKDTLSNLDKILEREGKIEDLVESTGELQNQSTLFQRFSAKQKWMEIRRNVFWTIVLIICCLILLAAIVGIVLLIVYA